MQSILAKKHTGMRVDHSEILGRIANGCKVRPDQRYILGEMEKHLEEVAKRFYGGDIKAVDEFLQIYCLDEHRHEVIAVQKEKEGGEWTLTSPDGREYKTESPLRCCRLEINERVPAKEQLENAIMALYRTCMLCDDEILGDAFYLAKGTPAEIGPLCLCCRNTIIADVVGER